MRTWGCWVRQQVAWTTRLLKEMQQISTWGIGVPEKQGKLVKAITISAGA